MTHTTHSRFTFIGVEIWEYTPETVKISNFATPEERIACAIFFYKFPSILSASIVGPLTTE